MQYTILSIAFPFAPLQPHTSGGAEQILLLLDKALTEANHRSIVIAGNNSVSSGMLIEVPSSHGVIDDSVRKDVYREYRTIITRTLQQHHIDMIHFHGLDFHEYLPDSSFPTLVTLHLPIQWYHRDALSFHRPNIFFNCVSRSQQRQLPSGQRSKYPVIENGVALYTKKAVSKKEEYVVCMGRMCPEKGYHYAIEAARKAGIRLVLAGQVYPYRSHQDYFRKEIYPKIDNETICFLGPIGPSEKEILLSNARCVLIPSLVPETSSLVAMEALMCATPVIAFNCGALPKIVTHGTTGYIVSGIRAMARAIHMVTSLDPLACRNKAHKRFSAKRMTSDYLQLYTSIITAQRHNQ